MMKRVCILLLIFFAVIGFSGMTEAKLIKIGTATISGGAGGAQGAGNAGMPGAPGGAGMPRGPGGNKYNLIYEDDQGLIWLDYTHSGGRNWYGVVSWASGLNDPGVLTYELDTGISVSWDGDWRLPKTVDGGRTFGYDGTTTAGFNITTSEMGHLYYVSLGNLGYYDTNGNIRPGWGDDSAWGVKNKGPFNNLRATGMYWSGTEYSAHRLHAWAFNFAFGYQGNAAFKSSYPYLGIAVRPGKVVSAPGQ